MPATIEPVKVDPSLRMIIIQASFTNEAAVPELLMKLTRETTQESGVRRERATGVEVIAPVERVNLATIRFDMTEAGFVLVNATYQRRVDQHNSRRTYHTVRFVYVHTSQAKQSDFDKKRVGVLAELGRMLSDAFWRVRVFNNPYFKDGVPIGDERMLSINLEARVPRYMPDGTLVAHWKKDVHSGERVGDRPLPIEPAAQLTIKKGILSLV